MIIVQCAAVINYIKNPRDSVRGVVSLGGHFACLCRGFEFYEVKFFFVIIFQKENGSTFTILIIFIVKSLQKSKIAQIYELQSAGINVQSPQSESTLVLGPFNDYHIIALSNYIL